MSADFDLAVVGAGFGGSLLALIARRLGLRVVLIERGAHPRFAIGESSSPLANLLLEDLCARYELDRIAPLASWGTWRRRYPEVGCGLKRGFTFYAHRFGRRFEADAARRNELLVAASPHDEVADTHWLRADFDEFLAREAAAGGAEYLDRTALDRCDVGPESAALEGERLGRRISLRARFVVDASGPRGFLHRALRLPEASFDAFPENEALYTHFSGVRRIDEMSISDSGETPPYPVDDAAMHHVFPGGWIWVLRFASGIVSAGVAATPAVARDLRLEDGEPAWARLLARLPTVREQFESAAPVRPFVYASRVPFRSRAASGPRWALLPSAAASIDPMLSTGIPLTLAGISRLAETLEAGPSRPGFEHSLALYAAATLRDADTAAHLIAALYASFDDSEVFTALSLLYFASASFTETACRLGRARPDGAFLSADHATFGPALRRICRETVERPPATLSPEERRRRVSEIRATIEPLDVAGLADSSRRNWHPVAAAPLLAAAHKLGATRGEVLAMLRRTGFVSSDAPAVRFEVAATMSAPS